MTKSDKIFCAYDTTDLALARQRAQQITPHLSGIKLGLEFFCRHGQEGVRTVLKAAAPETGFFLDLKLHDIPNTVAGALRAVAPLAPDFITLHAAGGGAMVKAAAETAKEALPQTTLLAVTVLTHMTEKDLRETGSTNTAEAQVLRLAETALEAGAGGLVCSPLEISALRGRFGDDPVLAVPGIRPDSGAVSGDDQSRVMTPEEALEAGADFLVIGRPVMQAENPADAAERLAARISSCTAAA